MRKIAIGMITFVACVTLAGSPGVVHAADFISVDASAHTVAGAKAYAQSAWTAPGFLPCDKYVASSNTPGGSPTGSGTIGDPIRSLKYAIETAQPGDTICVQAGTYQENHFVPKRSGTYDQPIQVIAQPGPVTIIPDPSNPTEANKSVFDFSDNERPIGYWGIDSFTIQRELNGVHYDAPPIQLAGLKSAAQQQQAGQPENAVHHLSIQNITMSGGKGSAGVLLRGRVHDVLMRNIKVQDFHRWTLHSDRTVASYSSVNDNYGRFDTHGIAIEGVKQPWQNYPASSPQDPQPAPTYASVERISIEKSHFLNNGGDGVQCLGADPYEAMPTQSDPKDIDMVDNKIVANATGTNATEEDGYDIKSCKNVSIRGSKKPLDPASPENISPSGSAMTGFTATYPANDWNYGSNNSDGAGIVLHQYARNILIENNRFSGSCYGIKVGLTTKKVNSVVVRGNLFTDLALFQMQPDQQHNQQPTAAELQKCRGIGMQITNVGHADIYNNTFNNISATGMQLAAGYESGEDPNVMADISKVPNNVDIWNNIISLKNNTHIISPTAVPGFWINMTRKDMRNIDSNYNLLWHPDNSENHFVRYPGRLTFSAWKSDPIEARDKNSLRSSPLFSDITNYFTQTTSPARDTGVNLLKVPTCNPTSKLDIGYVETCF